MISTRAASRAVAFLAGAAVFFAPALGAKPAPAADSAPVLVSTKGTPPKWKNLAELQQLAAKGDPGACQPRQTAKPHQSKRKGGGQHGHGGVD